MSEKKCNHAFIDSQNLYLATTKADDPWKIDMQRFRVYLRDKYHVDNAYCFMGAYNASYQHMYNDFQKYGYILVWREHSFNVKGQKKGNVDVDIVFEVMKEIADGEDFGKIVLVSGDGDYKRMVDYLIRKQRFKKILLPNRKFASSLYKQIADEYQVLLDTPAMRLKIGLANS